MIPVFGRIFGEPLPAYFTLLMVGFALATYVAQRWARRSGYDHDVMIDLGLVALIAGVAGGRILHVLADGYFWDYVHLCTDPSLVVWKIVDSSRECVGLEGVWNAGTASCHAQIQDCFAWAKFWNGGLTYYGGLIGAIGIGVAFLRREGFPLGPASDIVGVVVPLGIFFGRLGCFFGGCCFGLVTEHPFGLKFPAFSAASEKHFREGILHAKHLESLPVHPTQLYEAIGCLAISALLAIWVLPRKRFHGQVLLAFLGLYAVLRFGLEYLRDDDRGAFIGMSTSQLIGVAILGGIAAIWGKLERIGHPAQ